MQKNSRWKLKNTRRVRVGYKQLILYIYSSTKSTKNTFDLKVYSVFNFVHKLQNNINVKPDWKRFYTVYTNQGKLDKIASSQSCFAPGPCYYENGTPKINIMIRCNHMPCTQHDSNTGLAAVIMRGCGW